VLELLLQQVLLLDVMLYAEGISEEAGRRR